MPDPSIANLKRLAGQEAARSVESGMRLGLGTGSTVAHFLDALGERLSSGELVDIAGVPTSIRTETRATQLGIPLLDLADVTRLDLCVDGADEVDPCLDLIKGLGGALLREKMVAQASDRFIVIADGSKLVDNLGDKAPVPVEVVPFAWRSHVPFLESLGSRPQLRTDDQGEPYVTDNGNVIIDCRFENGMDANALDRELASRAGVVDSGLFLGIAGEALIAVDDGVRKLARDPSCP